MATFCFGHYRIKCKMVADRAKSTNTWLSRATRNIIFVSSGMLSWSRNLIICVQNLLGGVGF